MHIFQAAAPGRHATGASNSSAVVGFFLCIVRLLNSKSKEIKISESEKVSVVRSSCDGPTGHDGQQNVSVDCLPALCTLADCVFATVDSMDSAGAHLRLISSTSRQAIWNTEMCYRGHLDGTLRCIRRTPRSHSGSGVPTLRWRRPAWKTPLFSAEACRCLALSRLQKPKPGHIPVHSFLTETCWTCFNASRWSTWSSYFQHNGNFVEGVATVAVGV